MFEIRWLQHAQAIENPSRSKCGSNAKASGTFAWRIVTNDTASTRLNGRFRRSSSKSSPACEAFRRPYHLDERREVRAKAVDAETSPDERISFDQNNDVDMSEAWRARRFAKAPYKRGCGSRPSR
ncbi:MAG: hypothetical protein DMF95_01400 [Acidobacteria bacterium]|nr:MAG: hypothetical protein DMF95_01400 [Acidobacteriota bacterium]